jgi:hypothetical protein
VLAVNCRDGIRRRAACPARRPSPLSAAALGSRLLSALLFDASSGVSQSGPRRRYRGLHPSVGSLGQARTFAASCPVLPEFAVSGSVRTSSISPRCS